MHPGKTKIASSKPLEDVFPLKNGDFALLC